VPNILEQFYQFISFTKVAGHMSCGMQLAMCSFTKFASHVIWYSKLAMCSSI